MPHSGEPLEMGHIWGTHSWGSAAHYQDRILLYVDVEEQQGLYCKECLFCNANNKTECPLFQILFWEKVLCKYSRIVHELFWPQQFPIIATDVLRCSSMKSLSEASWGNLLAPKLLNCVCFTHLCTHKGHVFSVLLHYDKYLSYTTHLLWHIWSKEKEHCRRQLQKVGLRLQTYCLCLDVILEENERVYSLDTTLAHCMGKQVT